MFTNLWIALPNSSISDEQTRRDKTIKISIFARACSIFRVKRIYIYPDKTSQIDKNDSDILKTILSYLDTPQYLRKILYPHMHELEYAGKLHPIKSPHHKKFEDIRNIKAGDVRVGVLVRHRGASYVELGLGTLAQYDGTGGADGKKINVKFTSVYPNLRVTEARLDDIKDHYWGYEVREVLNLNKLLKESKNDTQIVITSKKGTYFKNKENILTRRLKSSRNLLIVFGSPKKGVAEILASEGQSLKRHEFIVNMFPFQGTETVRLEEAVIGTLAIFNHVMSK